MFRVDPPHAGTMRTKATRCQVLSAVGPTDLQDDRNGKGNIFNKRGDPHLGGHAH